MRVDLIPLSLFFWLHKSQVHAFGGRQPHRNQWNDSLASSKSFFEIANRYSLNFQHQSASSVRFHSVVRDVITFYNAQSRGSGRRSSHVKEFRSRGKTSTRNQKQETRNNLVKCRCGSTFNFKLSTLNLELLTSGDPAEEVRTL